jgi:hypothetical protein
MSDLLDSHTAFIMINTQIVGERVSKGDAIVDYEDKVFEDIQAEPGEKAYILMHTVPFEGSVGLVNMLTATRINRAKGSIPTWCSTVQAR